MPLRQARSEGWQIRIERYLAKNTTKIIALSAIQKRELSEQYNIAAKEKIEIIPLGLDLKKFHENQFEKRKKFRSEFGLDEDEIAVGIIGRLVPIKNHYLFLKAIKSVLDNTEKRIRAFIIGDGEERQTIERSARSLGLINDSDTLEKNVLLFTSWRKDIDVCYAGLDIIVLTSDNEGTPVSLIEAQAAGKAIACTNVGGIDDIILRNETALVSSSRDEKGFYENLLQLVENSNLRKQFSQRGWQFVSNRFGYDRLCADTARLYSLLLDES
jgi:glycosyltransferase involved in cell wall biosynthesis